MKEKIFSGPNGANLRTHQERQIALQEAVNDAKKRFGKKKVKYVKEHEGAHLSALPQAKKGDGKLVQIVRKKDPKTGFSYAVRIDGFTPKQIKRALLAPKNLSPGDKKILAKNKKKK